MNAEFAGTRAEQISADADVVAQVEQLVDFKALLPDRIFFDVGLQAQPVLLQLSKSCLAHQANRQNPSGNTDVDARGVQFLCGLGGIVR